MVTHENVDPLPPIQLFHAGQLFKAVPITMLRPIMPTARRLYNKEFALPGLLIALGGGFFLLRRSDWLLPDQPDCLLRDKLLASGRRPLQTWLACAKQVWCPTAAVDCDGFIPLL